MSPPLEQYKSPPFIFHLIPSILPLFSSLWEGPEVASFFFTSMYLSFPSPLLMWRRSSSSHSWHEMEVVPDGLEWASRRMTTNKVLPDELSFFQHYSDLAGRTWRFCPALWIPSTHPWAGPPKFYQPLSFKTEWYTNMSDSVYHWQIFHIHWYLHRDKLTWLLGYVCSYVIPGNTSRYVCRHVWILQRHVVSPSIS